MQEPPVEVDEIARRVIGAAIEMHRSLGPGFLESVYEEALAIEFDYQGITYHRQAPAKVMHRGRIAGDGRADFIAENHLVVELKAVETMKPIFAMQTKGYMKAGGYQLGLLINFNVPMLRDGIKRIVLT